VKCDIAGLFLRDDNREFDPEAERHFWMEAETRDLDGDAAGDSLHAELADERIARLQSPGEPEAPPPPPPSCPHPPDRIVDEWPATDDGYLNRHCGVCGESLRCRPVEVTP